MFRASYAEYLGLKFLVESRNFLSGHLHQIRKMFLFLKHYQFCLSKKDKPDETVVNSAFLTLLKPLNTE